MRKNFLYILWAMMSFFTTKSFAQNVAINEDGSAANPNAILDIKSFTKGILIPRVSTTGRLAIPNTKGLLVFDSTAGSFFFNTGAVWQNLGGTSGATTGWLLTGNSGAGSFLGTTDATPLRIKVFNQPSGLIDPIAANTFWGNNAGANAKPDSNDNGSFNTATGHFSMFSATSGNFNTSAGSFSMRNTTSGNSNTAIGFNSLMSNSTGSANTSAGSSSLQANTTGSVNTATGNKSLLSNTTGEGNTANGFGSLRSNITGFNNTAIGSNADVLTGGLNNATAIGFSSIVNASNKVRIGNSAVTVIEGQVPFTTPSDGRFKYQVKEDVKGLDFIMQLRPVTYQFDVKRFDDKIRGNANSSGNEPISGVMEASYNEAAAIRRTGFIAQEVEKAANASGYDFSGIIKPKTDQEHYGLSYESFVVPLVKAVQEQQQTIQSLQQTISTQNLIMSQQDKKMADLQKQIDALKQLAQHSK